MIAPALLVVAAVLLDGQDRICLQQRPAAKHHGGLWEFPGGKVEPGEHPEQALCREIAEELAIRIAPGDVHPCGFAASPGLVILLYAVRHWAGEPTCIEAAALTWCTPAAARGLAMPPLDEPLLDQVARLLAIKAI